MNDRLLALALISLLVAAIGVGAALSTPVTVQGPITVDAGPNGPTVTADPGSSSYQATLQPEPNADTSVREDPSVTFETDQPDERIVFVSDDNADITYQPRQGVDTVFRVSQIDGEYVYARAKNKNSIEVRSIEAGRTPIINQNVFNLDDGERDLSVINGSSTVKLQLATPDTDVAVVVSDQFVGLGNKTDSGRLVTTAKTDGSGDLTVDLPRFDSFIGNGSFELVTVDPPVFNNSSASPAGGGEISGTTNLKVNVSDADFDDFEGDEVTVTFRDGQTDEVLGTDTLTSSGTAITSATDVQGGQNSWYAVAEDKYGNSVESDTFVYQAPSQLFIYNESQPSELVTNASVEVDFFSEADDTVVSRNTTDGTIDLEGLPAGDEFIASVNADGFNSRSVVIDSLAEQQEVYLLPTSADTVEVRFEIDDQTGQFTEDNTRVFVQRPITQDGTTVYKTVASDSFGANGYTVTLERGQRYRVRIQNDDGDQRTIEPIVPTVSETIPLEVNQIEYQLDSDEPIATEFGLSDVESNDNLSTVRFALQDATNQTSDVSVLIYPQGNKSAAVVDETFTSEYGELVVTEVVNTTANGNRWVVEYEGLRDGSTVSGQLRSGDRGFIQTSLPQWLQTGMSIFGILLVAGLGSQVNAPTVGIGVVFVASLAWFIGWLPTVVSGGVIVMALAVPVLSLAGQRGGGGI